MTEFSPSPQQQQSPEKPPDTPTKRSNGFLNKWGNKINAVTFSLITFHFGQQALDSFSRGDIKWGILNLAGGGLSATTTGINIALERHRNRSQQRK